MKLGASHDQGVPLTILAALVTACGRPGPVPESPPDTAAIRATVDSFETAFAAEDSARLGRLLSADSAFIFFGTGAREVEAGRQVFLAKHETQDWAQLDSIRFGPRTHLRIRPRRWGGSASRQRLKSLLGTDAR